MDYDELENRAKKAIGLLFEGYRDCLSGDSEEMVMDAMEALETLVGKKLPVDWDEANNLSVEEYTDGWVENPWYWED